ncbi:MAG: Tol-Pal system protein TolB [Parachlamydiaceae bacterium]
MKYYNLDFLHFFFLLFICMASTTSIDAAETEDPIVVCLKTEAQRIPLYLTHFNTTNSGVGASYCTQLENILQFDLDHNGMTYILKSSTDKEKQAAANVFDQSPKGPDWKAIGAFYVVKVRIQDKSLSARLFAANGGSSKSIDGLALSGDLARDRRQIHQLADTIHQALFGSDGIASTRLLYTVKNHKGTTWTSEVWESDYDGQNRKQISTDGSYAVTPVYVPPKKGCSAATFFFVSYSTGQPKIYYQKVGETTPPHRLSYLRGNQLMPAITRQRDKIAFISDITGNPDLFILPFSPDTGATGKPYQIFSTHLATQASPTFSPDGSQIAFVSNKDGSPRIYMMSVPAPGTSLKDIKATLVTKRNKESTAPAWSPDGTKIAYCAVIQGTRQIWVYDLTSREERQITQGPGNKENPSWAPNSLHLVYNSSDAGSCNIYLINLNQPDATKITSGSGEKRFPSWEPR